LSPLGRMKKDTSRRGSLSRGSPTLTQKKIIQKMNHLMLSNNSAGNPRKASVFEKLSNQLGDAA